MQYRSNMMVSGDNLSKMKFDNEQMKNIETIRYINKNSSKELAVYVDDRMGKVPIFGYPLMCYSPNEID